jgi:transcription antitermination factor NusG
MEQELVSDLKFAPVFESQTFPWYAIRAKSRLEPITSDALAGKGYDTYLPVYRDRRTWSDRVVQFDVPLFPGYLFCRFDAVRRLPVLTTPGVLSIVGFGKSPQPIDDQEIEAVKTVLASGVFSEPCPFLREGDRVRIVRGALEGLEGILIKKKTQYRMVISVTMLMRSVSVEIDSDWIVDAR